MAAANNADASLEEIGHQIGAIPGRRTGFQGYSGI